LVLLRFLQFGYTLTKDTIVRKLPGGILKSQRIYPPHIKNGKLL
jgi:hypothetical protein